MLLYNLQVLPKILYYEEKLTRFSIYFTYSFLFSQNPPLPSPPNSQTKPKRVCTVTKTNPR